MESEEEVGRRMISGGVGWGEGRRGRGGGSCGGTRTRRILEKSGQMDGMLEKA